MSDYLEPIDQIISLMKETFKSGPFKVIYDGDPDLIPTANLPALCIVQPNDADTPAGSDLNYVLTEIQIRVVFNKQDDWEANNHAIDLTDRKIRRIIGGRDATGKYHPTSIKGALTQNLTLNDGAYIQQEMSTDLGTGVRPNNLVTREGILTVRVQRVVHLQ